MPLQQRWTGGRVWLITPVLKTGGRNAPGVRIPPCPPSVVVQKEEYLRRRRGDVWCYPPKPTEPKLNREDDVI